MKYEERYLIGIDCGTHTGLAIWDNENKEFIRIETKSIHQAIWLIGDLNDNIFIRIFIEDPNTWKPYDKSRKRSDAKKQGAGSIKRDFAIWRDFLTDLDIPFEKISLQQCSKKMKADAFKNLTGWKSRTSEHSRDAAMMVWKR